MDVIGLCKSLFVVKNIFSFLELNPDHYDNHHVSLSNIFDQYNMHLNLN